MSQPASAEDPPSITCPKCQMTSYNPTDVLEGYCGACHLHIERSGDPRLVGGDIAGPGGPRDRNAVVIDTRNSVLLDYVEVALLRNESDGRDFITIMLDGRINRGTDRTRIVYIASEDGAAALVTEIEALIRRSGTNWRSRYHMAKADRIKALKTAGNW